MEGYYINNSTFFNSRKKSIIFILSILIGHPIFSQQTIVLNSNFESSSNHSKILSAKILLTEAFRRIGYQLEIVELPSERSLINANRGLSDGEALRLNGLQKKFPNLIQVPEVIMFIDIVLLSKSNKSFEVKGWESVISHSLGFVAGIQILEQRTAQLMDKVELTATDDLEQLFTLLENDRVDFIAQEKVSSLTYLQNHNITNITIHDPPLEKVGLYIYLHKKNKKIVPQLTAVIKQMKIDGTFQAIYAHQSKPHLKK